MNDYLLNSPFSKVKACPKCRQNPVSEYITQELKSNKSKQEKASKILKFILEQLSKEEPKSSLKERANHAWMLSMWSKAEIDLLEREIKT
jgi:hypothetical protein